MKSYSVVSAIIIGILAYIFCAQPILAEKPSNVPPPKNHQQNQISPPSGPKSNINRGTGLIRGTVIAVTADSLTIKTSDGKEYTIFFDGSIQWRRRFWGKSSMSEVSVGDVLNIHGKWKNDEMTQIQARLIRNVSVQKRQGVFFGTVKTLSSNGWIMTTAKRGDQTVTIGGARLVNRKEVGISQSDILAGHRVRVKGLWDSKNNTVTEVTQVKDFDLPARTTPTPQP